MKALPLSWLHLCSHLKAAGHVLYASNAAQVCTVIHSGETDHVMCNQHQAAKQPHKLLCISEVVVLQLSLYQSEVMHCDSDRGVSRIDQYVYTGLLCGSFVFQNKTIYQHTWKTSWSDFQYLHKYQFNLQRHIICLGQHICGAVYLLLALLQSAAQNNIFLLEGTDLHSSFHLVSHFHRVPLWLAQLLKRDETNNVTGWEDKD